MARAFIINSRDDVVTLSEPARRGEAVQWEAEGKTCRLAAREDIPRFHKMALRFVCRGTPVLKYGESIGRAVCDIEPGSHVHVHNISDMPEPLSERGAEQRQ